MDSKLSTLLASAAAALQAFDLDVLARVIREADGMLGRELALQMLPEIARRHVLDVDPA